MTVGHVLTIAFLSTIAIFAAAAYSVRQAINNEHHQPQSDGPDLADIIRQARAAQVQAATVTRLHDERKRRQAQTGWKDLTPDSN
jgi:Flp pilus assembly protein TadB